MDSIETPIVEPKRRGGRPKGTKNKVAIDKAEIVKTPEFKAAVSDAVEEIMARLADKRTMQESPEPQTDNSFARVLASQIAELADQGSNRKRIAPAIMEKRRQANERMQELILHYRASNETPEYQLTSAVYLDEELVPPTYTENHVQKRTRIGWPGVPNESMVPVNAAAKDVFRAYMESIGGATPAINLADKKAPVEPRNLHVLHRSDVQEAPHVGQTRGGEMKILGRGQEGEITETRVLGTIAPAARQVS